MKRKIIRINEALCNGCGLCVQGCHEGALQLIDGKAVLISELYCDGLGACIGDCPVNAITMEEREAEAYDERAVIERMIPKGKKVIHAHLKHLADHHQQDFLDEAEKVLKEHGIVVPQYRNEVSVPKHGGCPGSRSVSFVRQHEAATSCEMQSGELTHWPVQLHLLSPTAPYLKGCDMLVTADCTAYALGDFHWYLKGKCLAIACPKLDNSLDVYIEKLTAMIDQGGINTLTVMIMEVPCCSGLMRICSEAVERARRKVPLKVIVVGVKGNILEDKWV
ncbi:MAG: 4Fe-4S ferredoxin [Bacteroidales bacterium]|jgi:ferredoxin|nr:4Fe-4S ferredoxin [Bacteroidales bacterium]